MNTNAIFALIAVVVAGLIGVFIYQNFEWKEEEKDLGPISEVKKDPYYLAVEMVKNMEFPLYSERGFAALENQDKGPSPLHEGNSLLLVNPHKALSPQRTRLLMDWVHNGGHLIYSAENLFLGRGSITQDHLLKYMEIEVEEVDGCDCGMSNTLDEDLMASENLESEEDEGAEGDIFEPKIESSSIYYRNRIPFETHCSSRVHPLDSWTDQPPADLSIAFASLDYLFIEADDSHISAGAEGEPQFAQFHHGAGLISVLSSSRLWDNEHIGCADNGYFLWTLIKDSNAFWILKNQDSPSLFSLIWKNAPLFAVLFMLSLVAWVWYRASRFGPIDNFMFIGRRRLMEHIQASGMFLWRHGEHQRLLRGLQDDIAKLMERKHRNFLKESIDTRYRMISKATQFDMALVIEALSNEHIQDQITFTRRVKLCQLIKDRL